jgi:hypothetical protein
MKGIILTMFLLTSVAALAQGDDTMAQLQEMAACMQTIDQNEIKGLEKKSKKFEKEVKGLCKKGKRDEAQETAIEFSKEMMNSPVLVTMRKCTEKMPASMKDMMPDTDPAKMAKDYSNKHVCDEI